MRTLVLSMAMAVSGWAQSHPAFWKYSHPEAKAVVGIDLERISHSEFGKRMVKELDQFGLKKMAASQGVDFVSSVNRVLISTQGQLSDTKTKDVPPVVVALQGKFDVARLRKDFLRRGATKSVYQGAEVFHPKRGQTDMDAAIVNSSVLLLGDTAALRAALDNFAKEQEEGDIKPLFQRAIELSSLYDVWFTAEISPADFAGANLPNMELLQNVQSLEGGASFKSGLGVEMSLSFEDAASASKVASLLQGLQQLALASAGDADSKELLGKIKIGLEKTLVSASLRYTQKELDRGLDQVKLAVETRMNPDGARSGSSTVAKSAPPAPPQPMVVKIYNADGGTREVAFR